MNIKVDIGKLLYIPRVSQSCVYFFHDSEKCFLCYINIWDMVIELIPVSVS